MRMTGTSGWSRLTASTSSRPPMPGICRSVRTTSGSSAAKAPVQRGVVNDQHGGHGKPPRQTRLAATRRGARLARPSLLFVRLVQRAPLVAAGPADLVGVLVQAGGLQQARDEPAVGRLG